MHPDMIILKLTCQIRLVLLLTWTNVIVEMVENAKSFCMPIRVGTPLAYIMYYLLFVVWHLENFTFQEVQHSMLILMKIIGVSIMFFKN